MPVFFSSSLANQRRPGSLGNHRRNPTAPITTNAATTSTITAKACRIRDTDSRQSNIAAYPRLHAGVVTDVAHGLRYAAAEGADSAAHASRSLEVRADLLGGGFASRRVSA